MTDIQHDTRPTAAIVTLGCPMNQVDSERIMGGLISRGFELVDEEEADVIIVNTCGFIDAAREESIETILSLAELKETGRLKSLVVAGCLAERYREELERDLVEADAVMGLAERGNIPSRCLELLGRADRTPSSDIRVVTGPRHAAYLRIAEGCNHRCSYCAIPMIRGRLKSIPPDEVVADAERLVALGNHELMLIAQDTTAYGSDLGGETLAGLLERLNEIDDLAWIRLMYAHPARFDDALVDAMATLPKVVPYVDIPVQHIAQGVLKRMSRPTDPDDVRRLVSGLRERIDGIVLRTSVMVGFPGETNDDYNELLSFIREAKFERLGAFAYSPEEGTRAMEYENDIDEETAIERLNDVMELQAGIADEFHQSLVGREFDVIVDDVDPETNMLFGRTYMDAPEIDGIVTIRVDGDVETPFVRARVTAAGTYDLEGEIMGPEDVN